MKDLIMLQVTLLNEDQVEGLPPYTKSCNFIRVAEITGHGMPSDQRILIGWRLREGKRFGVLAFITKETATDLHFNWPMPQVTVELRLEADDLGIEPEFIRSAMQDFAPEVWCRTK